MSYINSASNTSNIAAESHQTYMLSTWSSIIYIFAMCPWSNILLITSKCKLHCPVINIHKGPQAKLNKDIVYAFNYCPEGV